METDLSELLRAELALCRHLAAEDCSKKNQVFSRETPKRSVCCTTWCTASPSLGRMSPPVSPPSDSKARHTAAQRAPLIFLDIDGVICCNNHVALEEPQLMQLKRIVRATGAKVVLSSDWRRRLPLKQKVQRALKRLGVDYVGCTSVRTETSHVGGWLIETNLRPAEIAEWLQKRAGRTPRTWVAIDDRDLIAEERESGESRILEGHFVRTDPSKGLTVAAANEAIAILGEGKGTARARGSTSAAVSASAAGKGVGQFTDAGHRDDGADAHNGAEEADDADADPGEGTDAESAPPPEREGDEDAGQQGFFGLPSLWGRTIEVAHGPCPTT